MIDTFEKIEGTFSDNKGYSLIYFFDENLKETTKDKAENIIVKEYKEDGTFVNEIFLYKNSKQNFDENYSQNNNTSL